MAVRLAVEARGFPVIPAGVGVELVLQLEHVAQQIVLDGELRETGCLGEESAVLLRVPGQVRDGLCLARLVLLGECDGVVDEELDVVAPLELPFRKTPPAFLP